MTLVEFRNYSFTHLGQLNGQALTNINLKFEAGTTVGILGSAGAGKSTLIKTMGGLAPVEVPGFITGEIMIDGKNSQDLDPFTYSQTVGIVLDKPATQLLGLTVLDDVAFGPSNLGLDEAEIRKRIDFALTVTRLKGLETRNPEDLSGGQQQSLAIADILAMRPKLLAMDEPVSMLDAEGKERVLSIIKSLVEEEKWTVVITESGLDLESIIKYLDRLVVLDKGQVVLDGSPREVIASPALDEIGVGRTQLAELFLNIKKVRDVGQMPCTVEDAEQILRPLMLAKHYQPPPSKKVNGGAVDDETVVRVSGLWHTYPPDVQALKGIDISILKGEIVGLVGQNGSGKTTLCLHLVGVLKPTNPEAQVRVCDLDIRKAKMHDVIRRINYVFQNPDNQLFQESIPQELAYGLRLLGVEPGKVDPMVTKISKEFDLEPYLDYDMAALPREIRTILAMASVLVLEPKVLMLDEPTNAMDRNRSKWFIETLKRLNRDGLTILVVSHNMELLAKLCTRLIVITNGKVVLEGETREVFSRPEVLAQAKVKPPQITQLAQRLADLGFPNNVLTADEFFGAMYDRGVSN